MSQPLEVTDPATDAKEKAEWDKAAEHMLGGAPDPNAEEAGKDEDEVREFKYRGKTVRVDATTYDLLEGLKREARGANGRLGSELARTRERLARMEATLAARDDRTPRDTEPEIKMPDPMLATRDIAAWQAQYDAYRDAKESRRIAALERKHLEFVSNAEEQAQQRAKEKAWSDRFYSTYDHLDDPAIKPIVAQAYVEYKPEIDAFGDDVEGAHERLAELTDERLTRLKRAGRDADTETTTRRRPPNLESSAGPTPRAKEKSEDSRRDFSAASWSARERLRMQGREPRKER